MNQGFYARPQARFPAFGAITPAQATTPNPLQVQAKALMLNLPYPGGDPSEITFNNGYVQGANDASLRGLAVGAVVVLAAGWLGVLGGLGLGKRSKRR